MFTLKTRSSLAVIAFFAIVFVNQASARTYGGRSGYEIDIPRGWTALNPKWDAQRLGRYTGYRTQDWSNVDVILADTAEDEFHENINIVVLGTRLPVKQSDQAKIEDQIATEFVTEDGDAPTVSAEIIQIGGRNAWSAKYRLSDSDSGSGLWVWQVFMPMGGKTLVLTSMADSAHFQATRPKYEAAFGSLKIDRTLMDRWMSLPLLIRTLIVGAVLGLVVAYCIAEMMPKRATKEED